MSATAEKLESFKKALAKNEGKGFASSDTTEGWNKAAAKSFILEDQKAFEAELTAARTGGPDKDGKLVGGRDVTLAEAAHKRYGFAFEKGKCHASELYELMGSDSSRDTIHSYLAGSGSTLSEASPQRWLALEVFLEAVRLGLQLTPVYTKLIRAEQSVNNLTVNIPFINAANGIPGLVKEGESFSVGAISYGRKQVNLGKYAHSLDFTDELLQFSTIDLLAFAIEQSGWAYGLGMDSLAIRCLQSGDQADGSASAPTIGAASAGTIAWDDLDKIQSRMVLLGRSPKIMVTNEDAGRKIRALTEYRGFAADKVLQRLNSNYPLPQELNHLLTPFLPQTSVMFVDAMNALIRLVARGMTIETSRESNKQVNRINISTTFGFANLVRDARFILDSTQTFVAAPFPSYVDIQAYAARYNFDMVY